MSIQIFVQCEDCGTWFHTDPNSGEYLCRFCRIKFDENLEEYRVKRVPKEQIEKQSSADR